jgi:peptidoglycan hydrolase-like protein with peptidoglycan-binding domain
MLSAAHQSKGAQVVTWQQTLVKGGFLPNAPSSWDGVFGPLTTAATKLLQQKGGVAQDGVVGPDTRTAARKLGLW